MRRRIFTALTQRRAGGMEGVPDASAALRKLLAAMLKDAAVSGAHVAAAGRLL